MVDCGKTTHILPSKQHVAKAILLTAHGPQQLDARKRDLMRDQAISFVLIFDHNFKHPSL